MPYNLSGIAQNGSDVLSFTQGVNEVLTFGWLGTLILLGLVVVIFSSFMAKTGNDIQQSLAATAFIAFILALLLRAISLVGDKTLWITLLLSGLALAFTWNK
tara:strand:- start:218 stop:523 length:306 start_codon:yes stop_codon:yes gene_type:complete